MSERIYVGGAHRFEVEFKVWDTDARVYVLVDPGTVTAKHYNAAGTPTALAVTKDTVNGPVGYYYADRDPFVADDGSPNGQPNKVIFETDDPNIVVPKSFLVFTP